jgi:2-iminobutanoate/2-iminopropanoate deaminase
MERQSRRVAMNPPRVAAPIRPFYSNCVKVSAGPLLFISGQVPLDREGKLVGHGNVKAQAGQVLENIKTILEEAGASIRDVIKVTVFLTDIGQLEEVGEVRMRYFPADGPASTLVEVSKLARPEWLVEIDAVAAVP